MTESSISCRLFANNNECLPINHIRKLCFGFVRRLAATTEKFKSISPSDFVSVIEKMMGIDILNPIETCICDSDGNPDYDTIQVMYVTFILQYQSRCIFHRKIDTNVLLPST